jgi:hypothetical protein
MGLPSAGYSAAPLAAKLGFRDGMHAAFVALPERLAGLADAAAFATLARIDAWSQSCALPRSCDVVHAFTHERAEIAAHLGALQAAIRRDGMIWVSWPKRASRVATDVTEDVVRAEALKLDLVDVKVAAIDDVYSGLKLVIRKDRR